MTDWAKLEHAYGSAEDIPELLAKLSPYPHDRVWRQLYERICHQGSVCNASLPCLPFLLEAALKWEPKGRVTPLDLASAIVISARNEFPREIQAYRKTIEDLKELATDSFCSGLGDDDFTSLLSSAVAFGPEPIWAEYLNRLGSEDFEGECPQCNNYLMVTIGEDGFFTTTEPWTSSTKVSTYSLIPCPETELVGVGAWLFEQCKKYGYEERAHWFRYLFGQVECPHCGENISVAEAIKNGY